MGSGRRALRGAFVALAVAAAACRSGPYQPTSVALAAPLPAAAFATCRAVLGARYGAIAFADEERFLLQTGWQPRTDAAGERRAAVFREAAGLAVVVEVREVVESLFALPEWGPVRGDPEAERALAEVLAAALAAAPSGALSGAAPGAGFPEVVR